MPDITFVRLPESLSNATSGTDGLNALRGIPGLIDPQVTEETEEYAVISYTWDAECDMYELTDERAMRFGLRRAP